MEPHRKGAGTEEERAEQDAYIFHALHLLSLVPNGKDFELFRDQVHLIRRYNTQRLHSSLEHQTPEEYEQTYYAREIGPSPDDAANKTAA